MGWEWTAFQALLSSCPLGVLSVWLQGVISGPKSVQAWCITLSAEWVMEKREEGWCGSVCAALPSPC